MTFEKFKKLFSMMMEEKDSRSKFYDMLPSSISAAFFDNELVYSYEKELNMLIHLAFGDDIRYDVEYFLYEWKPGCHVISEKKEYVIDTMEEVLEYFREEYFDAENNITTKENK